MRMVGRSEEVAEGALYSRYWRPTNNKDKQHCNLQVMKKNEGGASTAERILNTTINRERLIVFNGGTKMQTLVYSSSNSSERYKA